MASLGKSLTFGALTMKNRIVMASMTRDRAQNATPSDLTAEYYSQRADAGLILSEGILIEEQGTEWSNAPGIYSSEQIAGWKKVTDAVHSRGSLIFAQLWHVGRVAHPLLQNGRPNVAPSAIAALGGKFRSLPNEPGYVVPTEIEDPTVYINLFKQAAVNAKLAGFDGVELHSANGYLANTFLEKSSNQRTDSFGGSAENRCRFVLESIKAMIDAFGDAKRVGIKLSPAGGYNDMGDPVADATEVYSHLITELDKLNIGYIQLARYAAFLDPNGRGNKMDAVKVFRPLIKNCLLLVNCCLTASEAEELITSNVADAAVFGRDFIANPDLALRILNKKEITPLTDWSTLYGSQLDPKDFSRGYTDYPPA